MADLDPKCLGQHLSDVQSAGCVKRSSSSVQRRAVMPSACPELTGQDSQTITAPLVTRALCGGSLSSLIPALPRQIAGGYGLPFLLRKFYCTTGHWQLINRRQELSSFAQVGSGLLCCLVKELRLSTPQYYWRSHCCLTCCYT